MSLIRNTIVFLDTGFFTKYSDQGKYDPDFLKYSRDEKVVIITPHLCLEEWRSQKVQYLNDYLNDAHGNYNHHTRNNPIADEILAPYPLRHPDQEEINEKSQKVVNDFVEANGIIRYMAPIQHIDRTWTSYFRGFAPFRARKTPKDIPDAWVYEAARDIRFHEDYKHLKNRFCIGSDSALKGHLQKLGFKPISVIDILEQLRQEEAISPIDVASTGSSTPSTLSAPASTPGISPAIYTLNDILGTALTDEMREIYIRVLGYAHWLSNPSKDKLFGMIERRGFRLDLVKAAASILSQPALGLIQDTGNHILPSNQAICEEAGNLITAEMIESLE